MTRTQLPVNTRQAFRMRKADCSTRWWVESETDPGHEYLCDLVAYNEIGQCDCPDFQIRKEWIARRATVSSDDLRCKHLRAAREKMLNSLLRHIHKNETRGTTNE
jgi:hypothetical protein